MFPNPIKERKNYFELKDGWDFSFDNVKWQKINVPYCPESKLSGIGYTDYINECFYRTTFKAEKGEKRTVLHFGAVDYKTCVFVNGKFVGTHVGGFTPFEFDVSDYIVDGDNKLFLQIFDNELGRSAGGKQCKERHSHGCFYTRTTGIWQPVWIEIVPEKRIKNFYFYPDADKAELKVELVTNNCGNYKAEVFFDGKPVGEATGEVQYKTTFVVSLSEKKLWELGEGNLYDVKLTFEDDEVYSYFGLRKIGYEGYKFMFNGRSVFQRLVLDQGFYPDGVYTATEEQLEKDVDISMALGFNGARLHQKVFDPRFLYFCDKKGYMVWGEFPSWGVDYYDLDYLGTLISQWNEEMDRDFNHPSIITWCPLNEVWADIYDGRKTPDVRFVDAIYEFTKLKDPSRPCVDVSGGYHGHKTDVYDFHNYETADVIRRVIKELDEKDELNVHLLLAPKDPIRYSKGLPVNVSEYGGIAFGLKNQSREVSWGYGEVETDENAFLKRFISFSNELYKSKKISGICYTQLYDVEQEQNGLYTYDRNDKLSAEGKKKIYECITQKSVIEDEARS